MLITYADRIERMSPAQARAVLEADFLHRNSSLSTPSGYQVAIIALRKLRGINANRATKIIEHALSTT